MGVPGPNPGRDICDQDYCEDTEMSEDRDFYPHRVRLPGAEAGQPGPRGEPVQARRDSLRRVRRVSNWTAAALIAGTGATTVALASNALHLGTTSTSASSGSAAAAATPGQTAPAPSVGGAVATTGGSGATVTTTKQIVNGHVVITKVTHPAHYSDN